jgi:hypothetical protein
LREDGFEPRNVLPEHADLVGLFDLAGLLAQAEVEQLFAGVAQLGFDLSRREFADVLGGCG